MNLLLLAFGARSENHYQAAFAILSFFKDPAISRVMVMTDQPDLYRWLERKSGQAVNGRELPSLEIIDIERSTLDEWQGEHHFFWRIKIKAIQHAIEKHPGEHLMYIDSDTFLASGLSAIVQLLDEGAALMHCAEYRLNESKDHTVERMDRILSGKEFAGVPVKSQSWMWNAGVIGLPASRATELVELTLKVCDEMCATECPRRLIEQFAFSVALNHDVPLYPCEGTIGHYWGNKHEWNDFILRFLADSRLRDKGVEDAFARLDKVDWTRLPLEKRPHRQAERIKKGVDLLMPADQGRHFVPAGD
ncbi:MAG: hypothetical protein Q4A16_08690 [Lautropia sp.]|nr:hypothetical protein [Lautropia sp.]